MAITLQDKNGTNILGDSVSSGLITVGPRNLAQIGYQGLASLIDPGSVTGSILGRGINASTTNRMETSEVSPLFADSFNYTAQDTGRWNLTTSTMTATFTSLGCQLNSASSVTGGAYALFRPYFSYPIPEEGAIVWRSMHEIVNAVVANTTIEAGIFFAATTTAPTDGALFRYNSLGVLQGVVNFNGAEQTINLVSPAIGVIHKWMIVLDQFHAEFWIEGVLQGQLFSYNTNGQIIMSGALQPLYRIYNAATAPTSANIMRITDIDLWHTDSFCNRPGQLVKSAQGLMGYQGVSGGVMGSTAKHTNSSNPTAAVPTNTSAALGSGLGGEFWETASLAGNTDGIISSYQVPAGTVNQALRKLIINGINWMSMVQTVLAGGPFIYQCGLVFGHTAVSLATGEAAAAKAPRYVPIGLYTLTATAAVGTLGANFSRVFNNEIVVNAGEFVSCVVKNIGTIGTSGTIAHSIQFDCSWE